MNEDPDEFSRRISLDEDDDQMADTEADPEEAVGLLESSFISDPGPNMFGEIGRRANLKLAVFFGIHR